MLYYTLNVNKYANTNKRRKHMAYHKLSYSDIQDLQHLYRAGIPIHKLVKYFGITAPAVKYHVGHLEPVSLTFLLDIIHDAQSVDPTHFNIIREYDEEAA